MKRIIFIGVFINISLHGLIIERSAALMDSKNLEAIVAYFKPYIQFHEREVFLPGTIQSYVSRCDLYKGLSSQSHEKIASFDENSNVNQLGKYPEKDGYFLKPRLTTDEEKRQFYYGLPVNPDTQRVTQPVYANCVALDDNTLMIQYWFFYHFNGPTIAFNRATSIEGLTGTHQADWEHIDLFVHRDHQGTLTIQKIFFASHNEMIHGYYKNISDITINKTNYGEHPFIYSALSSHASFHAPGMYVKEFDTVSKNGRLWVPDNVVIVAVNGKPYPGQEWITYGGVWGKDGFIRNPSQQGPWRKAAEQYTQLIAPVKFKSNKTETDYFSLKRKVPTRVVDLCFYIPKSPQLPEDARYDVIADPYLGKQRVIYQDCPFGVMHSVARIKEKSGLGNTHFLDQHYKRLFIRAKNCEASMLEDLMIHVNAQEITVDKLSLVP